MAESRVSFALELKDIIDISCNNTKLIAGEVTLIRMDDGLLQADGGIDLAQADTLASTALDTYFRITQHKKLAYARP